MRSRIAAPSIFLAAVAGLALGVSACGGSNDAAGTVELPITVGGGSTAQEVQVGTAAGSSAAAAGAGSTAAASTAGGAASVPAGDAAAGKAVFTANCAACHTLKDAGATGAVGPNLDEGQFDAAAIQHQVENGGGAMPPFKGTLSDADIANVTAYVVSVAGK